MHERLTALLNEIKVPVFEKLEDEFLRNPSSMSTWSSSIRSLAPIQLTCREILSIYYTTQTNPSKS